MLKFWVAQKGVFAVLEGENGESKVKMMFIVFFDNRVLIHSEFKPQV